MKNNRMPDEEIMDVCQSLTLGPRAQRFLSQSSVSEEDVVSLCEQAMAPDGDSRFAVRNSGTGLFSTGGWNPRMIESGKLWDSRAAVRAHFQMLERGDRLHAPFRVPPSWEVVEFQLVEVGKPVRATSFLKG